jgi:hypothetical protein
MKPPIPITDPRFAYTPAVRTDVRETFKRAREEQAKKPAEKDKK